jgi:hypothetical protein
MHNLDALYWGMLLYTGLIWLWLAYRRRQRRKRRELTLAASR